MIAVLMQIALVVLSAFIVGLFAREIKSDIEYDRKLKRQRDDWGKDIMTDKPKKVDISITGYLIEKTTDHLIVDWYGGGKLTIPRSAIKGNWDQLEIGQWFNASVCRQMNGEVIRAVFIDTTSEPKTLSEEEITKLYKSIPTAKLDPVKYKSE